MSEFDSSEIGSGIEPDPYQQLHEKFPIQTVDFKNGSIAYHDMIPEIPRSETDIPTLSLVGWGIDQKGFGNVVHGLYEAGEHVVTVDFEGSGQRVKGQPGSSTEINRQAKLLAGFIKLLPQEKVKLLAHSKAALVVEEMLRNRPDIASRVDMVIEISPMGKGGKDNLIGLGLRQKAEMDRVKKIVEKGEEYEGMSNEETVIARERKAMSEKRAGKMVKDFVLKNPERALREVVGMAKSDSYDAIRFMKSLGIKVALIQGEDDVLNSNERVWRTIKFESGFIEQPDPSMRLNDEVNFSSGKVDEGEKEKLREFFRRKEATRDRIISEGRWPAMDSITQTAGGHDIYGKDSLPQVILKTIDALENPQNYKRELNRGIQTQPVLKSLRAKKQH